jgi:hypothetical protein
MSAAPVLPDSRLASPKCTVMADWALPDGTTLRCEVEPYFCANCGKHCGYCPRENTTFAFYLCPSCFDTYGAPAGLHAQPDEEFWTAVEAEMVAKYGRTLSAAELAVMSETDLPPALQLLLRESPYRKPR